MSRVQPAVAASRSASPRAAARYPALAHRDACSTPHHPPPPPPPPACHSSRELNAPPPPPPPARHSSRAVRHSWRCRGPQCRPIHLPRFSRVLRRCLRLRFRRRRRRPPQPPPPPQQQRWPPQRPRCDHRPSALATPTDADRLLRLHLLHLLLLRRHHRCCRLQPPSTCGMAEAAAASTAARRCTPRSVGRSGQSPQERGGARSMGSSVCCCC